MSERMPEGPSGRLHRYYLAAGATLVAAPAVHATALNFDPPGGLPITIDTTNTFSDPLDIDLDGDLTADFRIFYTTQYGGGFEIRRLGINFVMMNGAGVDFAYARSPMRYEFGEIIHTTNDDGTPHPNARSHSSSYPTYIDTPGNDVPEVAAYQLFRDRPGFLGLALQPTGSPPAYAGALLVSVNADGTELTVHGGVYETTNDDIFLLAPLANGFEDPATNGYFPDPVVTANRGAQ